MTSDSKKQAGKPTELPPLQKLCDEITSQSWFPESVEIRESFAKRLRNTFPNGSFDAGRHRSVIEESARRFYELDPQSMPRPSE